MALNNFKCNYLMPLHFKGLGRLGFAPVKCLAGKIISEMTYNVWSRKWNPTI